MTYIYTLASAVLYTYQLPMRTDMELAIAVTAVRNPSNPLSWLSEAAQDTAHCWNTN